MALTLSKVFYGPITIAVGSTPSVTWTSVKKDALMTLTVDAPTFDEELLDGSAVFPKGGLLLTIEIISDELDTTDLASMEDEDQVAITFGGSNVITVTGLDSAGGVIRAGVENGKSKLTIKRSAAIGADVSSLLAIT